MKAVLLSKSGSVLHHLTLGTVDKPVPKDDEILVKIHSAAINPVDWKMAKYGFKIQKYPHVLGCDFSGHVEEIGANVKNFKKGDAVWGFTGLVIPGRGTFAEYCVVPAAIAGLKSDTTSFEEASTLGVGALTAALGLFSKDGFHFPVPSKKTKVDEMILVWGGATSVGQYVVQLAKVIGMTVIATCSARNAEFLKSLGADYVVDYTQDSPEKKIQEITGGKLKYAFDTVSTDTAGADIATIAGEPTTVPKHVKNHALLLGDAVENPEGARFVSEFVGELKILLDTKKVRPNPVKLLKNGLAAIPEGFKLSSEGKVSAEKLVVNIAETP